MTVRGIVFGDSLVRDAGELERLVTLASAGTLTAERVDLQSDGDLRLWAVDASGHPLLQRLREFGLREYRNATGDDPKFTFIMVNHIDAARSPNGSGGGWHRDSSRRQFKAFMYLTDVVRQEQGAFCFLPGSNSRLFWAASMIYRLVTGGNRYSDRAIDVLTRLGFREQPVLAPAGVPFFLNTSLVHRGLRIREGHRVMATLYICEDVERMSPDFKEYYSAYVRRAGTPSAEPAHA